MGKHTVLLLVLSISQFSLANEPIWGNLANPGFENTPIKSTFFFTGNWRNGVQFYDYNPSNNTGLFTIHPEDARHLGWSENATNRDFAVNTMIDAGVNVINMSYWGLPGTDNWAHWAPMQSSTASHDELFTSALGKDLLIAPYIESFASTVDYNGFTFADDFPGSPSNPAPLLISMIEDLVDRYLINPVNTQWTEKWARVYDKAGVERYLISIIHVASNQNSVTDQSFAEGFDLVADAVFESRGVRIGFALDILPPDSYAPGLFKATPLATGPWLAQQNSVVAIQCFIPEIWTGMSNETDLISWKRSYHTSWINTNVPVIHDISPGYDAHIVFPASPVYGNNQTWRNLQSVEINELGSKSITFNAWNGYSEGFAGMPTVQYGDDTYQWICTLFEGSCGNSNAIFNQTNPALFLEVVPNPVSQSVIIRFKNQQEHIASYDILDGSGVLTQSWSVHQMAGPASEIQINMEQMLNGLYFLIVQTDKGIYSTKILKVE